MAVMVNHEEIKLLSDYEITSTVLDDSKESRVLANGVLNYNESVDYSVSVWMDKSVTTTDAMNKVFSSKIVITGEPNDYNPVKAGYTKLRDAILANEYQTTPEKAMEKINAKQKVDLTNVAPAIKWLETTGSSITTKVAKPASSAINSDSQTSNLTNNDTLLRLYKTKTFNSETGRYTLSNPVYVDPSALDFNEQTNGGIKYYFQTEFMSYNSVTGKLYTSSGSGAINVYQVTGATKDSDTTTTWNGISYPSITYTLNLTTLSEIEIESDKSDKGLYAASDRFGTTYYYRGDVKNNNVLFADIYWKIVRINGDGSIRLMYDGKIPNATGINQNIDGNFYQFNSKYNNPAYVGYMYGNTIGIREYNIKNEVNSTIKKAVDAWYKTNILDAGYSSYIADAGFCNDRSLYAGSIGDGAETDKDTYYGAYDRYVRKAAIFTCPNEDTDLFTLTTSNYGNKALIYPVGLITYDELVFAGMDNYHLNKLSWVYSTNHYWTMSPSYYSATNGYANEWRQSSVGGLGNGPVSDGSGARPVISLNADVEITEGLGTPDNPFVVKTN